MRCWTRKTPISGAQAPTTRPASERELHVLALERPRQVEHRRRNRHDQRGHSMASSHSGRSSSWIPRLTPDAVSSRGRPVELDRSLHHQHTVEVVGDGAELVRHEQDGRAVLRDEVDERVAELSLRLGVDAGDRLVEHEQVGFARERACDQDTLLLPAGELEHRPAGELGQADRLDRVVDRGTIARACPTPPAPTSEPTGRDDLADGDREIGREHATLRDVSEPGPIRERVRIDPEEVDDAGVGAQQPEEEAEQGRLPGPVRPGEGHELARREGERHVVDDPLLAVRERHVLRFEDGALDDPGSIE